MSKIVTVDERGARACSLAENIDRQQQRLRSLFGDDLDLNPAHPQAQIAGLLALAQTEIGEAIVELAASHSIDHAGGSLLDTLTGLLNVQRRAATHSTVVATLTGVQGTVVPAGSRAATTDEDFFETQEDVSLTPGGVSVTMRAVESGPVPARAGTLTRIVSVVAGWETVNNTQDAVLGVEGPDRRGPTEPTTLPGRREWPLGR